jgi:hypothetical protein
MLVPRAPMLKETVAITIAMRHLVKPLAIACVIANTHLRRYGNDPAPYACSAILSDSLRSKFASTRSRPVSFGHRDYIILRDDSHLSRCRISIFQK